MIEPIVVLIDLPGVPQEVIEMQVQEALRERFPDVPVEVLAPQTMPLPPGAAEALEKVMSRGPEGMLADLQDLMSSPESRERMDTIFAAMKESLPVAGEERAPDYPPEESA